jgi:hypothetical protein
MPDNDRKVSIQPAGTNESMPSTSKFHYLAITPFVLAWYVSSTIYVQEVQAAKNGEHMGVHLCSHAVFYALVTFLWEAWKKNEFDFASTMTFSLAALYHNTGTAFALYGIWHLGGTATQMVKLLEPVIVRILLMIFEWNTEIAIGQACGSLLVILTVTVRLVSDPAFEIQNLLLALGVSVWYPLRNTVWKKSLSLSSAVWSVILSAGVYLVMSYHLNDFGAIDRSVIVPGALFGCYQLSSLIVLDAVQPQMHSTLNIGKRCCTILGLSLITEKLDMANLLIYTVGLIGAGMISFKPSMQMTGIITVFGLILFAVTMDENTMARLK